MTGPLTKADKEDYSAPGHVRDNITPYEKTAMTLAHLGIRVRDEIPFAQFEALMRYKSVDRPFTVFDAMRAELMAYIRDNDISLKCDGICTNHLDQTVTACYLELIEDMSALEGSDL